MPRVTTAMAFRLRRSATTHPYVAWRLGSRRCASPPLYPTDRTDAALPAHATHSGARTLAVGPTRWKRAVAQPNRRTRAGRPRARREHSERSTGEGVPGCWVVDQEWNDANDCSDEPLTKAGLLKLRAPPSALEAANFLASKIPSASLCALSRASATELTTAGTGLLAQMPPPSPAADSRVPHAVTHPAALARTRPERRTRAKSSERAHPSSLRDRPHTLVKSAVRPSWASQEEKRRPTGG